MTTALASLARSLRAGARGLLLRTDDEARAVRLLEALGEELGWHVHTWSATAGSDSSGTPTPLPVLLRQLCGRRSPALGKRAERPCNDIAPRAARPGPVLESKASGRKIRTGIDCTVHDRRR